MIHFHHDDFGSANLLSLKVDLIGMKRNMCQDLPLGMPCLEIHTTCGLLGRCPLLLGAGVIIFVEHVG